MKHLWTQEELIEHFTLSDDEVALLLNRAPAARIGFAVLLKFFQHEGRFPLARNEIPKRVVAHIADQMDVPQDEFLKYPWKGRSIKRHRIAMIQA